MAAFWFGYNSVKTMSDGELKRYLMHQSGAQALKGKVVDRIEREGDRVKIWFEDGTAIEISGDRPQYGRLMVYQLRQ